MVRKMRLNKMVKPSCIILVTLFVCSFFTGCFDKKEVEDFAYAVAIGLDKGKTNSLRLTLQIAIPTETGGGGGGGGNGGDEKKRSKAATLITIEAPTIYSALNMANTYISKELNLSHVKVIVFSEELAREGIQKYIHTMVRWKEFRPSMYVAVARCSAEEYLENVEPVLEINYAKFYELTYSGFRYTGFIANTQFINFYVQQESYDMNPVAVLAGITKYKTAEDFTLEESTYKMKGRTYVLGGDFKAGDMTVVGDLKSEVAGLAVFKGDKMVGDIDAGDTALYSILVGQFNHSYVTIKDPIEKEDFIVLNIKQSRKPKHKVEISGDRPEISVSIMLEADILSIQSGINYEKAENLPVMEKAAEDFIKKSMEDLLTRTTKEFESDIIGFGKAAKGKFLTWDEWEKFDWNAKYKNSVFTIQVDVKVRRPGLVVRTFSSEKIENGVY
jgi:spore germination protein KC